MTPENQTYAITQDTLGIAQALLPDIPLDLDQAAQTYLGQLERALVGAISDETTLTTFEEGYMTSQLEAALAQTQAKDPETFFLCVDRFLLTDFEEQNPNNFGRISVTRTASGDKRPRQNVLSLPEQATQLIKQIGNRPVALVDDGIFTGGTIKFICNLLSQAGLPPEQITQIIGFMGDNNTREINGIPVTITNPQTIAEWVDIRDFGIFGGKQVATSQNNRVTSAAPYIFPWTNGEGASLNMSGQFLQVSRSMITAQIELLTQLEQQLGRPIRAIDLVRAGFPLPASQINLNGRRPDIFISQRAVDYLEQCLETIAWEQQRQVYVFDMDGTLYQLDGPNNRFTGSSLDQVVIANATVFVQNREDCTPDEAAAIVQQGLSDQVGISRFLSQRYGITREQYFDEVWNINPQGVIQGIQEAVEALNQLREQQPEAKFILLTAAPRAWQRQVIAYLQEQGLPDCFELVFTAEDFATKDEVFRLLTQRYSAANITSVGDQERTDLEPAAALGCNTIWIQQPDDINQLITD